MNTTENLHNNEVIDKLKSLVDDITICFFYTDLKANEGSTCRPMSSIKVCDQGNICFFSEMQNN